MVRQAALQRRERLEIGAGRQGKRPGARGLLLADPPAELRTAHHLVALEVELLLAQHRDVEAGLQQVELLALARGIARTCRGAHLLDPVGLAGEQLAGPGEVGEFDPCAPNLALHHEPAIGGDRVGGDRRLLHATASQFTRAGGRELLAHAHLEHGHVLRVEAEGIHRHVDRAEAQLRVHELSLGDGTFAHRQGLGRELPQHRVALDGETLGLCERQGGAHPGRRPHRRGANASAYGHSAIERRVPAVGD